MVVQSGQSVEDCNPSIKPEYIESWTVGLQRQVGKNTVVEVRYVANHGVDLWSAVNLNEVNTVENGFAQQFQAAQNNLAIANGISVPQLLLSASSGTGIKLTSNNYGNQGLPGQVAVPLITTAIGSSTDQTTVTQLTQGRGWLNRQWHRHQRYAHGESHKGGISHQPLPGEPATTAATPRS